MRFIWMFFICGFIQAQNVIDLGIDSISYTTLPSGIRGLSEIYYQSDLYNVKADSLFIRMDAYESPTTARKVIISRHIDSLEAIISWNTIDILYILAAHDLDVSLLNCARLDTFNAEAIDHPTFAEDTGWTGDGSAAHITTGYNMTTDTIGVTNTDFMFVCYVRTNDLTDNKALYGRNTGGNRTEQVIRTANSQLRLHNTNTTYQNVAHGSDISGCHFLGRKADTIYYQKNDGALNQYTKAYQTTTNGDIYILQSNGANFSLNQVSYFMLLRMIPDGDILDELFTEIERYLDELGAGVVE